MKNINKHIITMALLCAANITIAQVTILNNVRPGGNPRFLGWDGTGTNQGNLEIRNDFDDKIDFFTNGAQRATILNNGHVGIGLNHSPGNDVLDILPDVPNTGYGINHVTVLHNSGSQNIFAGENAGKNIGTGFSNSFFGMDAGVQNIRMGANTYIGWCAGRNFDRAENTFIKIKII